MFEGLRLGAYQDTGGVWTIGFGHTKTAKKGMKITAEQAVELFEQDAAPLIKMVEHLPSFEAAALISFGFNCGETALRRVLEGRFYVTADGFFQGPEAGVPGAEYGVTAKGAKLPGLVARRRLEAAMIEVSRHGPA